MSHQCHCGRDLNNNYVSYTNAYANANTSLDRDGTTSLSGNNKSNTAASSISIGSRSSMTTTGTKAMFTTMGAFKELRDKETSRHTARAGDRRN